MGDHLGIPGAGGFFAYQKRSIFSWAPKSLQMVTAAMKLKDAYYLEESYDQPRQHIPEKIICKTK